MLFMKRTMMMILAVFFVGCTKNEPIQSQQDQSGQIEKKNELVRVNQTKETAAKEPDFSKTLREAIYFSNSLEREALKLILKEPGLQKNTLFSVLSYVVETNSGAKKSTPFGLDCGTYDVRREEREMKIFKSCVKPEVEAVRINIVRPDEFYRVRFLIKEWASVVGWAVALTGSDIICDLHLKEKKLHKLTCENWSYQTREDQISSTVVRIHEFVFERTAAKQFVIKGGFFKELVENKKIDIVVPLEGKIKIFEKEIKVIDEFAEEAEEKKNEVKPNEETETTGQKESEPREDAQNGLPEERPEDRREGEIPNESETQNQQQPYIEPPQQLPEGVGPREVSPEIIYGPYEGYPLPSEDPYEESQQPPPPAPTRSRGR